MKLYGRAKATIGRAAAGAPTLAKTASRVADAVGGAASPRAVRRAVTAAAAAAAVAAAPPPGGVWKEGVSRSVGREGRPPHPLQTPRRSPRRPRLASRGGLYYYEKDTTEEPRGVVPLVRSYA